VAQAVIRLRDYVSLPAEWQLGDRAPWEICAGVAGLIKAAIRGLPASFTRLADDAAVHETATVEGGAILKPPCIIGAGCFVAAGAYLRGGVWLGAHVILGPSVEIKSSLIGEGSKAAHFNFVGDSIVGADVNIEAGAILANYRNEWADKEIICFDGTSLIRTGCDKFGSLIGDGARIGANAVLAPGAILPRASVVPRLALVDQVTGRMS
jgi:bifunctional N-acetylglucosamine-1-phosphate-uridyltransferase/glucosamine-1-phosphate-acetyltransferase GlmU-like protein